MAAVCKAVLHPRCLTLISSCIPSLSGFPPSLSHRPCTAQTPTVTADNPQGLGWSRAAVLGTGGRMPGVPCVCEAWLGVWGCSTCALKVPAGAWELLLQCHRACDNACPCVCPARCVPGLLSPAVGTAWASACGQGTA